MAEELKPAVSNTQIMTDALEGSISSQNALLN